MAYGGKGRLNGIGRAQVAPMRGRKIVEGKEVVFIFAQAFTGLGIFSSIERDKLIISLESLSLGISQIHLVDQVFGFALLAFGQGIEYISRFMHPAALLLGGGIVLSERRPKPQRPIAHRHGGGLFQAPGFEVLEHPLPR